MHQLGDQLASAAHPLLDLQHVAQFVHAIARGMAELPDHLVLGEGLARPQRQEVVKLAGWIARRVGQRLDVGDDIAHLRCGQDAALGRHLGRQSHGMATVADHHGPVRCRLATVEQRVGQVGRRGVQGRCDRTVGPGPASRAVAHRAVIGIEARASGKVGGLRRHRGRQRQRDRQNRGKQPRESGRKGHQRGIDERLIGASCGNAPRRDSRHCRLPGPTVAERDWLRFAFRCTQAFLQRRLPAAWQRPVAPRQAAVAMARQPPSGRSSRAGAPGDPSRRLTARSRGTRRGRRSGCSIGGG